MGGRGSKKMSGRLMPTMRTRNKGLLLPGAGAMTPAQMRRMQAIPEGDIYKEFVNRSAQDEQTWRPQLSKSERDAVTYYQGSHYISMNGYLWDSATGKPAALSSSTAQDINNLTAALGKASLGQDTVTFRGITAKGMSFEDAQKLIGTTEIAHGFSSTTLNPKFAQGWAKGTGYADGSIDKPYIAYRYFLPKGAQAAYPAAVTSSMHGESEVLVQRGTQFKITGVKRASIAQPYGPAKNYIFIDAQYMGQGQLNPVKSK